MENDWKTLRDKYLKDRIQDQLNWYNKKSGENKKWFHRWRLSIIVSGALIPLLIGYANGKLEWLKYIAGILGALVAIAEGVLSLKRYREHWSTYRLTAERLNRERWLYENKAKDEYKTDDEEAFRRFVLNAEQIMSSENEEWISFVKQSDAADKGKSPLTPTATP